MSVNVRRLTTASGLVASVLFFAGSSQAQTPPSTESEWVWLVQRRVHLAKVVPPSMYQNYENGEIRVKFAVDPSGRLLSSSIIQPSCYDNLNAAALETIKRAAPFYPYTASMPRTPRSFTIKIVYYSGKAPAGATLSRPRPECVSRVHR